MKRLKKMLIYFVIALFILAAGVWGFMQTAPFGADSSGDRLARVKLSKNYRDGAFQNVEPTDVMRRGASYVQLMLDNLRKPADVEPAYQIPSVQTNLNTLSGSGTSVVWFGHSSYLIKSENITLLIDPVLSGYASPVSIFGKAFPGTNVYTAANMPRIDVLVLSHDHYDHLDYQTVVALRDKVTRVVVPLGVGAHLERWGYDPTRITELDWSENVTISEGFSLTAVPARHFSGRGIRRGGSLWSAYVLDLNNQRIFLGGDSGYGPHFKSIGDQYGPFDLAMLECGQYGRDWPSIHMFPTEVAQAARDLHTKVLLPVHWAKFALALHPWREPIRQLTAAITPADSFALTTPRIGEPVMLKQPLPNSHWWEEVGK
ncbi:MBL fold metallo-hydrolase [Fibrella forsythiae]|uniref:MBL fold metallo-hydrolase n=1 Tax=Fibrella forsythiae TaxID=2817061 RepID=A0ABS3JNX6_9BACT|nr:MBL fold metallo-hydrolase [Fibrella forsythiae]MBO0951690.1 MBL fold metallo-hydrolase [Fibrella forsythiae]